MSVKAVRSIALLLRELGLREEKIGGLMEESVMELSTTPAASDVVVGSITGSVPRFFFDRL